MTEKSIFREEAKLRRNAIPDRPAAASDAARHFITAIQPQPGQSVGLYWPKGKELDPRPLMQELQTAEIVCALPVIQPDQKRLKFAVCLLQDNMAAGPFGIVQPMISDTTRWVDPDIFIVPLLAFDRHGHRLGYGAGHYDVTLAFARADKPVVAVGYAYDEQETAFDLPAEAHDEKLDWVVTPTRAIRITR